MRILTITVLIASMFAWGCAPSDPPPMEVDPTPTASSGEEITDMDFESGEVDQSAAEMEEEPAAEPTPEVP